MIRAIWAKYFLACNTCRLIEGLKKAWLRFAEVMQLGQLRYVLLRWRMFCSAPQCASTHRNAVLDKHACKLALKLEG